MAGALDDGAATATRAGAPTPQWRGCAGHRFLDHEGIGRQLVVRIEVSLVLGQIRPEVAVFAGQRALLRGFVLNRFLDLSHLVLDLAVVPFRADVLGIGHGGFQGLSDEPRGFARDVGQHSLSLGHRQTGDLARHFTHLLRRHAHVARCGSNIHLNGPPVSRGRCGP